MSHCLISLLVQSCICLQAAQQAQQEEQAQATARTAAQIAAQARKMRSRSRRVQPEVENPEADMYDEGSSRAAAGGVMYSEPDRMDAGYGEAGGKGEATPAKDVRGGAKQGEGKAYNLPLPPAFALLDIGKPGRRLGKGSALLQGSLQYRICLWLAIIVTAVTFILGVTLLAAYVALDPKQPTFELDEIRIQWWVTFKDTNGQLSPVTSNSTTPIVYLYADALLVTKAENPNDNIIMHYTNTSFTVSYQGVVIGSATVPPTVSLPKNSTMVSVEWKCDACAVLNVGHYLIADEAMGEVPLEIEMKVDASVEVGGVLSPKYNYATIYDVRIKPPAK
eukprot:TRINITY_DN6050_c0_g1_i1.p1 TRINITY_DN6050_c0_g1~~TRINITY_DN6050_c0_g1_i1.p1  ORF type:complete len:335 (-),score=52.11 TRINITY_DN6050_c0_g1_i1:805-1809(-)